MRRPPTGARFLAFALTAAVFGGLGFAAPRPEDAPVTVFVGTYTGAGSRGIYRLSLDPRSGLLGEPELASEATNPSFLALHPSGRVLYAVSETAGAEGRPAGAVSAFAVEADGRLRLLGQQDARGAGPCHLVVDRAGRHLLVANYGGGTVTVLPIEADGSLRPATSVIAHEGSGPNAARQEKPHAHGIALDPSERFALVADLGADRIFIHRFDAARGALTRHGSAALPPGSGPRHLSFDPAGRFVYSLDELSSTVTLFSWDAERGALRPLQTISTLPAGWSGANTAAEIALSSDGRFLYASNRGHDSLAVFRVDPTTGRLIQDGVVPAGGATPRHFALDPTGAFLLVAHQGSGSVASFRLDRTLGLPTATGGQVRVSRPACLLPVR